jgi:hypothetical protein
MSVKIAIKSKIAAQNMGKIVILKGWNSAIS